MFANIICSFGCKRTDAAFALAFVVLWGTKLYTFSTSLADSDASIVVSEIKEDNPENIVFLHLHEHNLGSLEYYFPEAEHYVCDETFTVLRTYDVFSDEIVNVGSMENIWEYTDTIIINMGTSTENYYTLDDIEEILQPDEVIEYSSTPNYYFGSVKYLHPYKLIKHSY